MLHTTAKFRKCFKDLPVTLILQHTLLREGGVCVLRLVHFVSDLLIFCTCSPSAWGVLNDYITSRDAIYVLKSFEIDHVLTIADRPTCEKGHVLVQKPYSRYWYCDNRKCLSKGESLARVVRFGCRECDFDLCAKCHAYFVTKICSRENGNYNSFLTFTCNVCLTLIILIH